MNDRDLVERESLSGERESLAEESGRSCERERKRVGLNWDLASTIWS